MTKATDMHSGLTADALRKRVRYEPETGLFFANKAFGKLPAGRQLGYVCKDTGYLVISLNHRIYKAHRLAWLYMTGSWPIDRIDHINGVKLENRFSNLREATDAGNNHNRHRAQSNNKFGLHGVYVHPKGKFLAHIRVNKKKIHLGSFDTPEQAVSAYLAAKLIHHPEYIPCSDSKPTSEQSK